LLIVGVLHLARALGDETVESPLGIPSLTDRFVDRTEDLFASTTDLGRRSNTPFSTNSNWYKAPSTMPKFRLRGRIDTDFLWSDQSAGNRATFGDLASEEGLRRARLGAEGHLATDRRYVAELDLATGQVVIRDVYFALGQIDGLGEFKMGHMREPFSLEGGTSANSFAFMERSLINVLDPARNWGIAYSRCGKGDRWTFSGGLFQAGTDTSDFQFGKGSTTAITARGTVLALYEEQGRRLMHLGLALSERVPNQGVISINQQPQSPLLDFGDSTTSPFIPKLTIPAQFQQLINAQWAYLDGSFWSQAEWYGSIIDQTAGDPVFYHGGYVDVGYFLTGDHRGYLAKTGFFGPVKVRRPLIAGFSIDPAPEQLGYGALEATLRCSYLDFVDRHAPLGPQGQQTGVMVPDVTTGVNWYLADRLRVMLNYSYVLPNEVNTGTTSVSAFGMRLAMFW